jgi:hypothetical protein
MLQLPQRLRLDLPDALARHRELLANFLQRVIGVHADAEAHAEHAFLAGGQVGEDAGDRFLKVGLDRGVDRDGGVLVLDEVGEVAALIGVSRLIGSLAILFSNAMV